MRLFKDGLRVKSPVGIGVVFELRPEHLDRGQFDDAFKTCYLCEGGEIAVGGDYAVLVHKAGAGEVRDGDYSWADLEFAHMQCANHPNSKQQQMMEEGGFAVCVFPK